MKNGKSPTKCHLIRKYITCALIIRGMIFIVKFANTVAFSEWSHWWRGMIATVIDCSQEKKSCWVYMHCELSLFRMFNREIEQKIVTFYPEMKNSSKLTQWVTSNNELIKETILFLILKLHVSATCSKFTIDYRDMIWYLGLKRKSAPNPPSPPLSSH